MQLPADHTGQINSVLFSPVDAHLLVTASNDGTARIWELPSRRVLHVLSHATGARPAAIRQAVFSPDGRQIDGVRGRPSGFGKPRRAAAGIWLDGPVLAVAYSADGRQFIAGGRQRQGDGLRRGTRQPLVRYLGHTAAINTVALSPDGSRALTGSSDRSARFGTPWPTIRKADGTTRIAGRTAASARTAKRFSRSNTTTRP